MFLSPEYGILVEKSMLNSLPVHGIQLLLTVSFPYSLNCLLFRVLMWLLHVFYLLFLVRVSGRETVEVSTSPWLELELAKKFTEVVSVKNSENLKLF